MYEIKSGVPGRAWVSPGIRTWAQRAGVVNPKREVRGNPYSGQEQALLQAVETSRQERVPNALPCPRYNLNPNSNPNEQECAEQKTLNGELILQVIPGRHLCLTRTLSSDPNRDPSPNRNLHEPYA